MCPLSISGFFPASMLAERHFVVRAPAVADIPAVGLAKLLVAGQTGVEHAPDVIQADQARHLRGKQILQTCAVVPRGHVFDLLDGDTDGSR
jgi:hypothetical protein